VTDQIAIEAIDEKNPEEFWAAFDEAYPEIADAVREGETLVDAATWEAIQRFKGFADGPVQGRAIVAGPEEGRVANANGMYEVQELRAGGYAVVDGQTGEVHSEHSDHSEAIETAVRLNQDGE
jgi:hypothetical protein